jgi:hypothetical protein
MNILALIATIIVGLALIIACLTIFGIIITLYRDSTPADPAEALPDPDEPIPYIITDMDSN